MRAGVPQAGEHLQLVAQLHQPVLLCGPAFDDDMIPSRPAGCADQQRIGCPRLVERFGAYKRAVPFPAGAMQQVFADIERKPDRFGRDFEHLQRRIDHFGPDTIAAHREYLQCHHATASKTGIIIARPSDVN